MPRSPLAADPAFRRYWLGRLTSYAGDQVARTALLIAVFDRQGGGGVGLLLLVSTAPRLLGPLLGAVADRFDQRRLMIGCDIAQAVLYAIIALTLPPLPVLLALTALGTGFATLFTPAGRSLIPRLVAPQRLPAANAALAVAMNVGIAAGPALGGLLLAGTGLTVTLLVNAVTFAVSAVLLAAPGFGTAQPAAASDAPEPLLGTVLRAGLAAAWHNGVVRVVALMLLVGVLFAALDNVALVPYGRGELHASPALVGALGAGYGLGMAAAPLLLALRRSFRADLVLYLALLGFATGTLLTGAYPAFGLALVGQALAGAGNGWQNVANDTLIQQHVPAHRLGTVFGTVYTFPYAAEVLAYAAGGLLLDHLGPRPVLGIAGLGVLATLAAGYPALSAALRRGQGPAAPPHRQEPAAPPHRQEPAEAAGPAGVTGPAG
jgi:predicted MFS family arabinose efflux permease